MPTTAVYGDAPTVGIAAGAPAEVKSSRDRRMRRRSRQRRVNQQAAGRPSGAQQCMANETFSKGLPATLGRAGFRRSMAAARAASGAGLLHFGCDPCASWSEAGPPALGWDHVLRGWLEGFVVCFGLCLGGMALLMVQYLSGGKWGLIVRRPLEAMTRTWPLVVLMWLPVAILGASFGKLVYLGEVCRLGRRL